MEFMAGNNVEDHTITDSARCLFIVCMLITGILALVPQIVFTIADFNFANSTPDEYHGYYFLISSSFIISAFLAYRFPYRIKKFVIFTVGTGIFRVNALTNILTSFFQILTCTEVFRCVIEGREPNVILSTLLLFLNLYSVTKKYRFYSFNGLIQLVSVLISPLQGLFFKSRTMFLTNIVPLLIFVLYAKNKWSATYYIRLSLVCLYILTSLSFISDTRMLDLEENANQTLASAFHMNIPDTVLNLGNLASTLYVYLSSSYMNGLNLIDYLGGRQLFGQLSAYVPMALITRIFCETPFCGSRHLLEVYRLHGGFVVGYSAYGVSWFTLPFGLLADFSLISLLFIVPLYILSILSICKAIFAVKSIPLQNICSSILIVLSILSLAGGVYVIWIPFLALIGTLLTYAIYSFIKKMFSVHFSD
jgi:hypothetical protein